MPHGRLMFSREHYEAISRLLPFLCHGNRHTHDPPAHERTVAVLFRDEVGLQRQAIRSPRQRRSASCRAYSGHDGAQFVSLHALTFVLCSTGSNVQVI